MPNLSYLNSVITCALLGGILFSGCDDPADVQESDGVAILTNLSTGKKLLLENGEGEAIVTSLSTRETLIAPGELAGVLTDEEYTALMPDEDEMHGVSLPLAGGGGATRWINVYSFYKSSTTSAIFCNAGSKPVRTIIKYQTNKATGTGLTIEIRKDGALYGSKDVWAMPSPQYFDWTWASTQQAGNFYVVIKKKGLFPGDDIVSGYFNLNN